MHKPIKRFALDGIVGDDSAIPRLRNQFEQMLLTDMRESGYVPVLGLGPYWSTSYETAKNQYDFVLSVYGVFVGKREACKVEGISVDGLTIPRTAPTKLPQSLSDAE